MLNEEVKRYRELSGDNNPYTPISRIGGYLDGYEKAMEQKTGWIPVSERLPGKDGCYLVSTTGTNNDIIDIAYYTDGIWHKASRIKAWMPLPEVYRGEEAET